MKCRTPHAACGLLLSQVKDDNKRCTIHCIVVRHVLILPYTTTFQTNTTIMSFNILLADDHVITMDGISAIIARVLPEARIDQVSDMDAALKYLTRKKTDLIICDINMPGGNHFGMVEQIRSIQQQIRILIMSGYSSRLYAQRYLKEGADAYLSKDVDKSEIEDTVLALLQGKKPRKNNRPDNPPQSPMSELSKRELEVAHLLIEGNGILEISVLLQLHANTVSTYKTRVFEKLNVLSVPELITLFRNHRE